MRIETVIDGANRIVGVDALDDGAMVVRDGDTTRHVRVDRVCGSECWRLVVDGVAVAVRIRSTATGADVVLGPSRVAVDVRRALPIPSRRAGSVGGSDRIEVRAPMPGLVVAIPRASGERVDAGSPVAVVEAMKMQMDVPAPTAGEIAEIRVRPGQEVTGGQVLVAIRSDGGGRGEGT